MLLIGGCSEPEPITTYVIPTKIPPQLKPERDRMLAAMVPHEDEVWFFKVVGPESATEVIDEPFREFVESIEFRDGNPDLSQLPEDWRLGAKKPMRFATIDINTPTKQLDVSISSLSRQESWDEQVVMNVNRWRDQLGLDPSKGDWAGAEQIETASTDGVWVDLIGKSSAGSSSMSPPMMGGMPGSMPPTRRPVAQASEPDPRLKSKRPDGWRDGKKSSMRWASYNVGPEDASAEVTVIPAGGDTRGNIKRWIGQIRANVTDEMVDQAMESADNINVSGRDAQRFILTGDALPGDASGDDQDSDADESDNPSDTAASGPQPGQSIDATIVPLEDNFSLFIKMTGPTETVTQQHDALTSFLESLEF
tara:strand:+ start:236141 stop:237235 length:1095 start_codon:yes stop_codon:yes gene_type:complete